MGRWAIDCWLCCRLFFWDRGHGVLWTRWLDRGRLLLWTASERLSVWAIIHTNGLNDTIGKSDCTLRRYPDTIGVLRCSSSWTKCTSQVPSCTSRTRELLITLRLCLGTVATGNGCPSSRLGYHAVRSWNLLLVLVPAMDGVMSLKEIPGQKLVSRSMEGSISTVDEPSRKGHMTCKAFEWLYVCVYTYRLDVLLLKTDYLLARLVWEADDVRVRICLSRCSSRVKDCPQ